MRRKPLPDLLGRQPGLPQERNGFGVQRFPHLPNLVSGFGELRPFSVRMRTQSSEADGLNPDESLLEFRQHRQDRKR